MAADTLPLQISQVEKRLAEIPQWAEKYKNRIKWIVGALIAIAISPFVLMGIGGLLGGLAFVAIGYLAMHLAPVFGAWVANRKQELLIAEANRHLLALKAQAEQNPVPTLWNKWNVDGQVLVRRRESLVNLEAQRRTFNTKLGDMRSRFGDAAQLTRLEERLTRMGEVIEARKLKLETMRQLHAKKKDALEMAEGIWELLLVSKEFDQADQRSPQEVFEAEFMEKTAFNTIELEWNKVGAEFDQMAEEELAAFRPSKTLGFNPSESIDVVSRTVSTPVPHNVTAPSSAVL